jgi:hypothetical protein
MNQSLMTGFFAVIGSLAGGSTSIVAAWLSQRAQGRREMTRALLVRRERLYSDFIGECSTLLIDALDHELDDSTKFRDVYALLNRIRLLSSAAVIAAADHTLSTIMQRYAAPSLTKAQMHSIALARTHDPLRPFSEACRAELLASRVIATCRAEDRGDRRSNGTTEPCAEGARRIARECLGRRGLLRALLVRPFPSPTALESQGTIL